MFYLIIINTCIVFFEWKCHSTIYLISDIGLVLFSLHPGGTEADLSLWICGSKVKSFTQNLVYSVVMSSCCANATDGNNVSKNDNPPN